MNYKEIIEKIADKVGITNFKFSDIELTSLVLENDENIYFLEDEITLGIVVYKDEEMTIVLEDGEYKTINGEITFKVIDGVVGELDIKEAETTPDEEVAPEQEEQKQEQVEEEKDKFNKSELEDGSFIYFLEDEIVEGISVYTDEVMETPVEDGSIVMVDGKTLTIVGGKIDSIELPEDLNSLKEDLEKLKLTIKELNLALKDADKEIKELSEKNEKLELTKIEMKKELDDRPAITSINFKDEEIIEDKKYDIKKNREITREYLRHIKK